MNELRELNSKREHPAASEHFAGFVDQNRNSAYRRGSSLEPEQGVEVVDGRTLAVTLPVWLRLSLPSAVADVVLWLGHGMNAFQRFEAGSQGGHWLSRYLFANRANPTLSGSKRQTVPRFVPSDN